MHLQRATINFIITTLRKCFVCRQVPIYIYIRNSQGGCERVYNAEKFSRQAQRGNIKKKKKKHKIYKYILCV